MAFGYLEQELGILHFFVTEIAIAHTFTSCMDCYWNETCYETFRAFTPGARVLQS